jgi:malate dehydrogenase
MYPDVSRTTVGGKPAGAQVDAAWLKGEFLSTVAKRGAAIIAARGASSAASAAQAAVDHMHDWFAGTNGKIVSMALPSEGWYGIPEGLIYSFPVKVDAAGRIEVVQGVAIDEYAKARLDDNIKDLDVERQAVAALLG